MTYLPVASIKQLLYDAASCEEFTNSQRQTLLANGSNAKEVSSNRDIFQKAT
jgi:hypothetical protein